MAEQSIETTDHAKLAGEEHWRRWIAENLMLDADLEKILRTLVDRGYTLENAAAELKAAMQSPYMRGVMHLSERLKKRDWLIASERKSHRMRPTANIVERRHRLPRETFLNEYYSAGRPVIVTGMMDDWPAMKKWSPEYFIEQFGDKEVEAQVRRNQGDTYVVEENYEIMREKYLGKMTMAEFARQALSSGDKPNNEIYLTAYNSSHNRDALAGLWDDIKQIPEYLDPQNPGGFFWFGPRGTITPFHHDLTNNFMAQVFGRKRILLAPPWDMPLMQNHYHVYSRIDGRHITPNPDPAPDEPQILECILSPGEMLFLPIGCMHFVEGLDISATMSFTNFVFDNEFVSFYKTYRWL